MKKSESFDLQLIWRVALVSTQQVRGLDTIFRDALNGRYDLVVAMYHDQGLIPLKMVAFESAVNVTLGISIVRTSPDHGTAFGISGEGKADPSAMREAMLLAAKLARAPRTSGPLRSGGNHPDGPARGEWSSSGPWTS